MKIAKIIALVGILLISFSQVQAISENQKQADTSSQKIISELTKSKYSNSQKINVLLENIRTINRYIVKYPQKKELFQLVIQNLENEIRRLSGVTNPTKPLQPSKPSKPNQSGKYFTPVYKTRDSEPAKINGIGNSKKYNSWRGK